MNTNNSNQGASPKVRSIVTALLLVLLFPVGLIVMYVWSKWPVWLKILVTLVGGLIFAIFSIPLLTGVLVAINPAGQAESAKCSTYCTGVDPEGLDVNCVNACVSDGWFEGYNAQAIEHEINIKNAENRLMAMLDLPNPDADQMGQLTAYIVEETEAITRIQPDNATAWARLGVTYADLSGVLEGADSSAIDAYANAVSIDPSNAEYHFMLGQLYIRTGQLDLARESLTTALELTSPEDELRPLIEETLQNNQL